MPIGFRHGGRGGCRPRLRSAFQPRVPPRARGCGIRRFPGAAAQLFDFQWLDLYLQLKERKVIGVKAPLARLFGAEALFSVIRPRPSRGLPPKQLRVTYWQVSDRVSP
jgi:hypothetical protein